MNTEEGSAFEANTEPRTLAQLTVIGWKKRTGVFTV